MPMDAIQAPPIEFSLQAFPTPARAWTDVARAAEEAGFRRLYCADHPGSIASPMLALAAAAAVTSRIELGPLVLNTGLREPFDIAADAATLDLLSQGRAVLGLGAGHTPAEWTQLGRPYPSAADRVARCIEAVEIVAELLAGHALSFDGTHIQLPDPVQLTHPRPVRSHVPLVLGGNGRVLLRHAARRAAIINLTGLGATGSDGHTHAPLWKPQHIDERLELIAANTAPGHTPTLEALVQRVWITDDAEADAEAMRSRLLGSGDSHALSTPDLLACPFVLIGTVAEIVAKLRTAARDRGITAYVVREPALPEVATIRAALESPAAPQ